MAKSLDVKMNNLEAWKKLNLGSQNLLKEIKDELVQFYNEFEPNIYPINSILEKSMYKTRIINLGHTWIKRWLEIFPEYIIMLVKDLIPKAKRLINVVGFDRELILDTIETETISMFKEFIINSVNDVEMYRIMYELETKNKYVASEKIVRNIDYVPFQFEVASGFAYNISFKGNNPNIDVYTQTKIIRFNDLNGVTDDEGIKKEIKDKLREVI